MKRKTLVPLLLLLSLAIPLLAFSQKRSAPTRASSGAAVRSQAQPNELEKNITISLKGKIIQGTPIDLALTGCGELFRSQVTLGNIEVAGNQFPIIGSIEYAVEKRDDLYVLQYSIGLQEPISTSTTVPGDAANRVTNTSIGFQEKLITGTVKCAVGKGVDIFRAGDSVLTLLVTE